MQKYAKIQLPRSNQAVPLFLFFFFKSNRYSRKLSRKMFHNDISRLSYDFPSNLEFCSGFLTHIFRFHSIRISPSSVDLVDQMNSHMNAIWSMGLSSFHSQMLATIWILTVKCVKQWIKFTEFTEFIDWKILFSCEFMRTEPSKRSLSLKEVYWKRSERSHFTNKKKWNRYSSIKSKQNRKF